MNANMSHIAQRTILSLMFGAGLLVLGAVNASAHEIEHRPDYVQHHYAYARSRFYPGWLKRNRQFQRWYFHNQYRFKRHISWNRLYDIYRLERRHRWHGRRTYNKVYRDRAYPTYYPVPRKHRH